MFCFPVTIDGGWVISSECTDRYLHDGTEKKTVVYTRAIRQQSPRFKAGQWVRNKTSGALVKVVNVYGNLVDVSHAKGISYEVRNHFYEPAHPKNGEVWKFDTCDECGSTHEIREFAYDHDESPGYGAQDWFEKVVEHGCLNPVNFGRGDK